eukprot:2432697-Prymnesium_polylepis.1
MASLDPSTAVSRPPRRQVLGESRESAWRRAVIWPHANCRRWRAALPTCSRNQATWRPTF